MPAKERRKGPSSRNPSASGCKSCPINPKSVIQGATILSKYNRDKDDDVMAYRRRKYEEQKEKEQED